tara:strand:- start:292 stop:1266 length:975 start_codon:yes stop_codon:yes gene_type:complete
MPYIGKGGSGSFGIRERYEYTATSGQTAFTSTDINGKVLTFDNGSLIDVMLNGVMLKITTDWSAASGTVTLTSGASTSDEVTIIVYDVFALSDALPKSGGTFSGGVTANAGITMGGTTPTLTIGDAGAEDTKIVFDGNAQDYHIGLDDSADTLNIGKGSALGTTTAMTFDANGLILKPLQCMFDVNATASQSLSSGTITKITFDTENADINSDFDLSNNKFIAPVAGKYLFDVLLTFSMMGEGAGIGLLWYKGGSVYRVGYHQSPDDNITTTLNSTVIFNLAASDEIEVYAFQGSGGTETIGDASNVGSPSADNSNYWSGFLLG